MHKYRLISKKGEGTFSEVLKAQSIKNGMFTAIKCMKNHFDSVEQVNNLREIQALQRLSPNPHIVKLYEVLYDQPTGRLALVFELMSMNMYELIRGRRHYLPENTVKLYMYQLIKAMDHMHRNGIFHRDIKPENILVRDDLLKVADFGSCRGIYSKQPYTEYISTRWYRAPECLLTDGYYGYKMDMWGIGCVMFEIIALFPLFPGTNELDQITKVFKILGTPPTELLNRLKEHGAAHIDFHFPQYEATGIRRMIPHASAECVDLIQKLVEYNPEERLSARQALRHPWFHELQEAVRMVHRDIDNSERTNKREKKDKKEKKGKRGKKHRERRHRDRKMKDRLKKRNSSNNASLRKTFLQSGYEATTLNNSTNLAQQLEDSPYNKPQQQQSRSLPKIDKHKGKHKSKSKNISTLRHFANPKMTPKIPKTIVKKFHAHILPPATNSSYKDEYRKSLPKVVSKVVHKVTQNHSDGRSIHFGRKHKTKRRKDSNGMYSTSSKGSIISGNRRQISKIYNSDNSPYNSQKYLSKQKNMRW